MLPRVSQTMKNRLYSSFFAVVTLSALYGNYTANHRLSVLTKTAAILLLLVWLYRSAKLKSRFHKQMFIGLVFVLLGDVYSAFSTPNPRSEIVFFACQFFAYLFYVRAFTLDHKSNPNQKNVFFIWAVIGLGLFCTGVFFYIRPQLGALQPAALVYTLTVCLTAITAINRYGKVNLLSFKMIFYAALFFVFANTVWAINKYVQPIPQSESLVLVGFLIAEYLLVYGTIVRKLLVTKTEV